jgi:hypothetical protein
MGDARYDPSLAELWQREPFLTLHDDICKLGQNYAIRTGMRLREIVIAPVAGVLDGDIHHVATPFGIVAVRFSSR